MAVLFSTVTVVSEVEPKSIDEAAAQGFAGVAASAAIAGVGISADAAIAPDRVIATDEHAVHAQVCRRINPAADGGASVSPEAPGVNAGRCSRRPCRRAPLDLVVDGVGLRNRDGAAFEARPPPVALPALPPRPPLPFWPPVPPWPPSPPVAVFRRLMTDTSFRLP